MMVLDVPSGKLRGIDALGGVLPPRPVVPTVVPPKTHSFGA